MTDTFESFDALTGAPRGAVVDLLFRMADDEIIMGHRGSEWTGHAPILEEDIAFSSMSQDEMGHALTFYRMLHELGESDPDTLAFSRKAREYRCCSLVALEAHRDWAMSIVRQFLYDAQESVRLSALRAGSLVPLADVANKLCSEEKYHLMHGRSWIRRLGDATPEAHERMQNALNTLYPHALGMFEPTGADEVLDRAGICPIEKQLQCEWESAVVTVLEDGGLNVPENSQPVYGGRVGQHGEDLAKLLDGMQLVYQIDPSAKW